MSIIDEIKAKSDSALANLTSEQRDQAEMVLRELLAAGSAPAQAAVDHYIRGEESEHVRELHAQLTALEASRAVLAMPVPLLEQRIEDIRQTIRAAADYDRLDAGESVGELLTAVAVAARRLAPIVAVLVA